MPQARQEIRDMFMNFESGDDGILKAEKIIEKAGGSVSAIGTIVYYGNDEDVWDAIEYLCNEWDYALI